MDPSPSKDNRGGSESASETKRDVEPKSVATRPRYDLDHKALREYFVDWKVISKLRVFMIGFALLFLVNSVLFWPAVAALLWFAMRVHKSQKYHKTVHLFVPHIDRLCAILRVEKRPQGLPEVTGCPNGDGQSGALLIRLLFSSCEQRNADATMDFFFALVQRYRSVNNGALDPQTLSFVLALEAAEIKENAVPVQAATASCQNYKRSWIRTLAAGAVYVSQLWSDVRKEMEQEKRNVEFAKENESLNEAMERQLRLETERARLKNGLQHIVVALRRPGTPLAADPQTQTLRLGSEIYGFGLQTRFEHRDDDVERFAKTLGFESVYLDKSNPVDVRYRFVIRINEPHEGTPESTGEKQYQPAPDRVAPEMPVGPMGRSYAPYIWVKPN